MKRPGFIFILLFSFFPGQVSGQIQKVDSLRSVYNGAENDTTRIKIYIEIGNVYANTLPDTAVYYYLKALNKCDTLLLVTSDKSEMNHVLMKLKGESLFNMGIVYIKGGFDRPIECFKEALKVRTMLNDKNGMVECYDYLGRIYRDKRSLEASVENYLKSLRLSEEIGSHDGIANSYLNLGSVYKLQNDNVKALEYYQRSLEINEEQGNKKGISTIYTRIGILYSDKGEYEKAIECLLKSLEISEEMDYKNAMAESYTAIGIVFFKQGNFTGSKEYFLKTLRIGEGLGDKVIITNMNNNLGEVSRRQGIYDKAVEYYLDALKASEEMGNKVAMAAIYNNIGLTHSALMNYDKAIENLLKSVSLKIELGDRPGLAGNYNNIGNIYLNLGEYDKANEYYLLCLEISKEFENNSSISTCYTNLGRLQRIMGNYDNALEYFLKSLKVKEELGENDGIAIVYNSIANLNLNIADSSATINSEERMKYLYSALWYGNKAYNLALEIGDLPVQNDASSSLMQTNTKLGRYREALKYAEIYIATQDSMFSESKTKALTEMSVKYEAEKKQLQLEKMEKQKELDDKIIEAQEAKNKKQQAIIISVIGGLVIVVVFSIILFRMFRQKRRANILLAEQNDRINQQNLLLSEQKKEITDSIRYAKRIQSALIPDAERNRGIFGDHFVLFRPKDIVSGDFYWGTGINGWHIVTLADCTGHGVPGAFMSVLGLSFLNEIARKKEITKASEIIEQLRVAIIEALQQRGAEGEQKDGMDVALCVINTHTNELQYCGANSNLILITGNRELREIASDKMPVAIYENMKPFTNHVINLRKGDTLYLASDGFEDQFGGEEDKKFKRSRLKNLLAEISDKPMDEQKEILENTFEKWKGTKAQTDDVTILGIRI